MSRVVAVDLGWPDYEANRAFDSEAFWRHQRELHGEGPRERRTSDILEFWTRAQARAARVGLELTTADLLDDPAHSVAGVLLVSHMFPAASRRLIARGARPAVLLCAETPFIAWDFYHRLRAISAKYAVTHTFPGARGRVRSAGGLVPMFPPQIRREQQRHPGSWADRDLISFVTSNKQMEPVSTLGLARAIWARLFSRTPQVLKPSIRRQLTCMIDPELGKDRYRERRRAIIELSRHPDFHLYGRGWQNAAQTESPEVADAVRRCYRGEVDDKVAALQRYRFTLCFENTASPGFITEKVFDAFMAGSIPVFDGAADIHKYIPPSAYIRLSQFAGYSELIAYLRAMTPQEAEVRRSAAADFMASRAFDPFDADHLAGQLVDTLGSLSALQRDRRSPP